MVSEAEFDKNQAAFKAAQAQMQTAGPSPTTGGVPTAGPMGTSPTQAGEGLLGLDPATRARTRELAMRGTPVGAVTKGAGIAANIVERAEVTLSNKAIALLSGGPIIGAMIAGIMAGPNTLIGKTANRIWSDAGIDVGDLRLSAEEQMFTMPVEDPDNPGQWKYLMDDTEEISNSLKDRMAEAGIVPEQRDNRMIQLRQIRKANQELINFVGPVNMLDRMPGELPFTAASRIAKERWTSNQIANAQGLTVAQVQQANQQFEQGRVAGEVERQKQESMQKKPPRPEEIAFLPPGQLAPTQLEAIAEKKLPNKTPETSGASKPSSVPEGGATPVGAFSPRWRTKAEAEQALLRSITPAQWNIYLKTGRLA